MATVNRDDDAAELRAMCSSLGFRANLRLTAKALHCAGLSARYLLASWPGTNDERRRIDWPEFAALEYLATDALSQAERLMALHEREEI